MKASTGSLLLTSLLLAAACGGTSGPRDGQPVGSRGQAAEAAYGLVDAKQGIENDSTTGRGLVPAQFIDGSGVEGKNRFEVEGKSGRATVEVTASVQGDGVRHTYAITFEEFSWDGIDFYDGSVRYEGSVTTDGAGARIREHVVGRCSVWGRYATELDMDVTIEVIAGAGGVELRVDGRIEADGQRFEYSGSTVVIGSDGRIQVDGELEVGNGDGNGNGNGNGNGTGSLTACAGDYRGTYRGDAAGTVEAELEGNVFRLTFISDLAGSPVLYTFDVDEDGDIDGSSYDLSVDATLDLDTCRVQGTWRNLGGASGTWSAQQ